MTRIIETADGSHSLINKSFNESYHSSFGAIQESLKVFIEYGFNTINKPQVRIYEAGLGTGLNALLTLIEAEKQNIHVDYFSSELYPPPFSLIRQINYPRLLNIPDELLYNIHMCQEAALTKITPFFSICRIQADIKDYCPPSPVDLVYFDAFSPDTQPELWSENVFRNVADSMAHGSILTTYSVKGIVKRALKNTGFSIEILPGPTGKRHVLRATY